MCLFIDSLSAADEQFFLHSVYIQKHDADIMWESVFGYWEGHSGLAFTLGSKRLSL